MLVNTIMNQGVITSLADGTSGTLEKVIEVTERQILKAAEDYDGGDPNIVDSVIPFSVSERKAARAVLEQALEGTMLVSQQRLGDSCSAIVAARVHEACEDIEAETAAEEATEEENVKKTPVIDEIILIGLNGNKDRDCQFTLEVYGEGGIIADRVTVTGYRAMDLEELASESNALALDAELATPSEASPSDADEADSEATPSDADEKDDDDDEDYSLFDDIELIDDISSDLVFHAYYEEELDEDAVSGLVHAYQETGLFGSLFESMSTAKENEDEDEAESPVVSAVAGGIVMARAAQTKDSDDTSTDKYVSFYLTTGEITSVKTGQDMPFHFAYNFNHVAIGTEKAYFKVQFSVTAPDPSPTSETVGMIDGIPYLQSKIPDGNDFKCIIDKTEGEMAGYENQIAELKELAEAYPADCGIEGKSWYLYSVNGVEFFYCPDTMVAILGAANGNSNYASMNFKFNNGTTPDGSSVTANVSILNRDELEEMYKVKNEGQELSEDQLDIPKKEATITSTAVFDWEDVTKQVTKPTKQVDGEAVSILDVLYPIDPNEGRQDWIEYTINSQPVGGSTAESGVIFTDHLSIVDTITLHGFEIDSAVHTPKWYQSTENGQKVWFLDWYGTDDYKSRLLKVFGDFTEDQLPGDVEIRENEAGDQQLVLCFTRTNSTLSEESTVDPSDMTFWYGSANLQIGLNLVNLWNQGKIKATGISEPKIINDVTLDAYSCLRQHDGSNDSVNTKTQDVYQIVKTAYADKDCSTQADKNLFEPGKTVFFKIVASNYGFVTDSFVIEDIIPDGFIKEGEGAPTSADLVIKNAYNTEASKQTVPVSVTGGKAQISAMIPAGGTAEVVLPLQLESGIYFENSTHSTTLENRTNLYKGNADGEPIDHDTENVYVGKLSFTESELELEKVLVSPATGAVTVGSNVSYNLKATLSADATYSQQVTITDDWPQNKINFTGITNLPQGTLVTLKDSNNEIIGTYEAEDAVTSPNTIGLGKFQSSNGSFLTNNDATKKRIDKIEVTVMLDKGQSVTVTVNGNVSTGGNVINYLSAPGIGPVSAVQQTSVSASITKSAVRIKSADIISNVVNGDTVSAEGSNVAYEAGDVVQYEIAIVNPTGTDQPSIGIELRDTLNSIFTDSNGTAISITQNDFQIARLNEKEGYIFRKIGDGNWEPLEYQSVINQETMTIVDSSVSLPAGSTYWLRFYLKIPAAAVTTDTRTYKNTANATITVGDRSYPLSADATIQTLQAAGMAAEIEKEVVAIGDLAWPINSGPIVMTNAHWYSNYVSNSGEYKGYVNTGGEFPEAGVNDYVFYRVTVKNTGTAALPVSHIQDELPDGMRFRGFIQMQKNGSTQDLKATADYTLNLSAFNDFVQYNDPTQSWSGKSGWFYYYRESVNTAKTDARIAVQQGPEKMKVFERRIYSAAAYAPNLNTSNQGALDQIPTIPVGESFTFGVVAKVMSAPENQKVTVYENKASVIVPASAAQERGEFPEKVFYDSNGTLNGNGTYAGGRSYPNSTYRAISAAASIQIRSYAPGIQKSVSEYSGDGQNFTPCSVDASISPNSYLHWMITLYNGTNGTTTKGPIKSYTIRDTMPENMVYNDADPAIFIDYPGKELPTPRKKMTTLSDGKTVQIIEWTVAFDESTNHHFVYGDDDNNGTDFGTSDLSIPAKGERKLQVGTKKTDDTSVSMLYKTYVNRADLIVDQTLYPHSTEKRDIPYGEPDTDANSIYAEARVNIYGGGGSSAHKTIDTTYNGTESLHADGTDFDAWVYGDAGSLVTYTLNVKSTAKEMSNLVLIDTLPYVGDQALLYSGNRGSEFAVTFPKKGTPVTPVVKIGETQLDSSDYDIYYADKSDIGVYNADTANSSVIPDSNWSTGPGTGWKEELSYSSDGYPVENCMKVVIGKNIASGEEVSVSFSALLPEWTSASDDTAWNSFAYAYSVSSLGLNLTVEPSRVGVRIPLSTLEITKKAEPANDNISFQFRLEKRAVSDENNEGGWVPVENVPYVLDSADAGNGSPTTTGSGDEAGLFELKHDQKATFTVLSNYQYRIVETDSKGYLFTAVKTNQSSMPDISEYTAYTGTLQPMTEPVTAVEDITYQYFFWNKKGAILPETGGFGTRDFYDFKMFLICLALGGIAFMSGRRLKRRRYQ